MLLARARPDFLIDSEIIAELYCKGECARAGAKTHCLPVQLSHSKDIVRGRERLQWNDSGRFARVFDDNLSLLAGLL